MSFIYCIKLLPGQLFLNPQFRTVLVALPCTFMYCLYTFFTITFIHVSPLYIGYWVPFPEVKWLGHGIEHPLSCSTAVMEQSCTSTTSSMPSWHYRVHFTFCLTFYLLFMPPLCLTFRHRVSCIQDRRFTTLQRTLFMYLINKYISLSDICLTVHH